MLFVSRVPSQFPRTCGSCPTALDAIDVGAPARPCPDTLDGNEFASSVELDDVLPLRRRSDPYVRYGRRPPYTAPGHCYPMRAFGNPNTKRIALPRRSAHRVVQPDLSRTRESDLEHLPGYVIATKRNTDAKCHTEQDIP
jgi:hypothetical protein